MKTIRLLSVLVTGLAAVALGWAAENEVTLVGDAQCAKCSLGQTPECANAMVVKQDGKDVTYFIADNAVSKDLHDKICTEVKPVKITGVVKETAGRKEITAAKIELLKKS